MQTLNRERESRSRAHWFVAVLAVNGILLTTSIFFGERWFRAFARVENPVPFLIVFFVLLAATLMVFGQRFRRLRWFYQALIFALIGHLLAIVSVVAVHSFQPDAVARFSNAIAKATIVDVAGVYLLLTLPLGGWLFGAVSAVSAYVVDNVWSKQEFDAPSSR
jgi:hypothetical protein